MKTTTKLWAGIGALIFLSPLGLIIPDRAKAGAAWGEWSTDEIAKLVGYMPAGLQRLSELWKAPFPDYAFQGWEEKGLAGLSVAYVVSAILGIAVVALLMFAIGKLLTKKQP